MTSEFIDVRGSSEPFIPVRLTRNGFVMGTIETGVEGTFEIRCDHFVTKIFKRGYW